MDITKRKENQRTKEKCYWVRMRKKNKRQKQGKMKKKMKMVWFLILKIWSWWHYRNLRMMTCLVICLTNMFNLRKLSINLDSLSHFNTLFFNN